MKIIPRILLFLFFLFSVNYVLAASSEAEVVRSLDAAWELALLNGDNEALIRMTHLDFVWIHNHVNTIEESRAELIEHRERNRAFYESKLDSDEMPTRRAHPVGASRDQHDVKVVVEDRTAIVYGYTIVVKSDRFAARNPDLSRKTTYHFMRTYTKVADQWMLLGNQTMAIPENE